MPYVYRWGRQDRLGLVKTTVGKNQTVVKKFGSSWVPGVVERVLAVREWGRLAGTRGLPRRNTSRLPKCWAAAEYIARLQGVEWVDAMGSESRKGSGPYSGKGQVGREEGKQSKTAKTGR